MKLILTTQLLVILNFLKEKIFCLRDIISTSKIDILCIDETKLGSSFPDSQFKTDGTSFLYLGKIEIRKAVEK